MAKDEQKKGKAPKGAPAEEPKAGPGAPRHSAKERPRLRVRFEKELAGKSVKTLLPPTNFPWALEMQIEDPDGNVLRFGSEPE